MCGAFSLLALASSCAAPGEPTTTASSNTPATAAQFPGVDVGTTASTLLHTGACVGGNVDGSGSLVITVANGETAYLTLRPSDNMVIVNGATADNCQLKLAPATAAFPAAFPAGKTISIVAGTVAASESRSVILDYVNGMFGESLSGAAGVININLGTAANVVNSVKVRGTMNADSFYFGKGAGTLNAPYLFSVNGGATTTVGLDAIPDVTLLNVQNLIVSTGPGADKISGEGLFGTTAAYPNAIQMFGGDGNDTLTGGAGADVLSGDLGGDLLNGGPGANTYLMGAVPQGSGTGMGNADIITVYKDAKNVYATDTVDYSARTGAVTVTLAATPNAANGETGEGATIPDTVSTVIGGWGNDIITAAASALNHTLKGGPGNDTLTGGTGLDTLVGGGTGLATSADGDDTFAGTKATVDYSARTTPITVKLDSTGASKSGDVTGTNVSIQVIATGGTAAAPASAVATLSGLAGMSTTDSVGHYVTLSLSTGGTDDGTYKIISCASATSCDIDTSSNANFALDAGGFSYTEDAHTRIAQVATVSTGKLAIVGTSATTTVSGLANMAASSVGHHLIITGSTGGTADSGVLGYKIVSVTDANTVVVDASATAGFIADVTGFTWAEKAFLDEADVVKAGSVIGSATAINTITAIDGGTHRITGGAGADVLTGGAGADTIYGLAGVDTIYGGAGDDTLMGGDGDDHLNGGDGNDLIAGDAGSDTFECDGNNAAGVPGVLPGNVDLTVDYTTTAGMTMANVADAPQPKPLDCDF